MIFGTLLSLHASYLPVKAWLSERFIHYSWQQSLKQNIPIKPWPWADMYPIAKLSIGRLNLDVVILNGGDPTSLAFSAGAVAPFNHLNSRNPFVVAGHRDSHFSFLEDVTMEDIISIQDKNGQNQLYQVQSIEIIDASSGELPLMDDESNLVLITCYPFNSLSQESNERYVIKARPL